MAKHNLNSELSPFLPSENFVFKEDYNYALSGYNHSPQNQFLRRTLFRTGLGYIEGILFQFKRSLLGLKQAQQLQKVRTDEFLSVLSPYLGFLNEKSYFLKSNGEIATKENFISLELNITYTIKEATRTYYSSYELDKSGNDWKRFLKSKSIRNRITHPKTPEEMEIKDDEIENIILTVNWFEKTIESLITEIDAEKFLKSLISQKPK